MKTLHRRNLAASIAFTTAAVLGFSSPAGASDGPQLMTLLVRQMKALGATQELPCEKVAKQWVFANALTILASSDPEVELPSNVATAVAVLGRGFVECFGPGGSSTIPRLIGVSGEVATGGVLARFLGVDPGVVGNRVRGVPALAAAMSYMTPTAQERFMEDLPDLIRQDLQIWGEANPEVVLALQEKATKELETAASPAGADLLKVVEETTDQRLTSEQRERLIEELEAMARSPESPP